MKFLWIMFFAFAISNVVMSFYYSNKYKKSVTDELLKLFAITFFFVASTFLLLFINKNYLHIVDIGDVKMEKEIFIAGKYFGADLTLKNSPENIDNETLLGIIATLVLFSGMLVYIFKRVVKSEIESKIKRISKDERSASKVENFITSSYVFGEFHDIYIENNTSDNGCSGPSDKSYKFLEKALISDKRSQELAKKLNKKTHGELLLTVDNNIVFNLVVKKEKYSNKITEDEKKILDYKVNKLLKIINSSLERRSYGHVRWEVICEIKNTLRKAEGII